MSNTLIMKLYHEGHGLAPSGGETLQALAQSAKFPAVEARIITAALAEIHWLHGESQHDFMVISVISR